MMKLLITGASGLVGSEIAAMAEASLRGTEGPAFCRGLRISQLHRMSMTPNSGCISADLTSDSGIEVLKSLEFDAIVHSAAWRDPERCMKDRDGALRLNFESTRRIAELAASKKAHLTYISTDYVFPGTNPPYSEDAEPSPVNHYGRTKLLGEKAVSEFAGRSAILRIPLQYGLAAGLERCPMLATTLDALRSGKEWRMDDYIVRYPTYSGDVAAAVMLILARSLEGIYHFSGQDKTTKYGLTLTIGRILGLRTSHIFPSRNPPSGEDSRPRDSHLSMDKIIAAGLPPPLPFEDRIAKLFKA